jgi:hypothetical protein
VTDFGSQRPERACEPGADKSALEKSILSVSQTRLGIRPGRRSRQAPPGSTRTTAEMPGLAARAPHSGRRLGRSGGMVPLMDGGGDLGHRARMRPRVFRAAAILHELLSSGNAGCRIAFGAVWRRFRWSALLGSGPRPMSTGTNVHVVTYYRLSEVGR